MKLWLENCWVFVLTEELQLFDINFPGGVVLIPKVAIWAKWQKVEQLIMRSILVDVMNVRAIPSANSAAMIVLVKQRVS